MTDLKNLDELRQACVDVVKTEKSQAYYEKWGKELHQFLGEVCDADLQTRMSVEFQRRIWDKNPVANAGMGNISVDAALGDPEFRRWLAEQSVAPLPDAPKPRVATLNTLADELETRMGRYTKNMPRLKIYTRIIHDAHIKWASVPSMSRQVRELRDIHRKRSSPPRVKRYPGFRLRFDL